MLYLLLWICAHTKWSCAQLVAVLFCFFWLSVLWSVVRILLWCMCEMVCCS